MRCAGVITRGIVLIIVPLLSLTADLITKFDTDDHEHGIIEARHFDEDIGCDQQLRKDLITDMRAIDRDTNCTLFLFISPQSLHMYCDLRAALLACHTKKTFRFIMLDEFHLFCQHGIDFRHDIRLLCNEFIRPIMQRHSTPYLLTCTATCSLLNIGVCRRLSVVELSSKHRIWADPLSFQQRNIDMTLEFTHQYARSTAPQEFFSFYVPTLPAHSQRSSTLKHLQ
jgi:hypothetical protein